MSRNPPLFKAKDSPDGGVISSDITLRDLFAGMAMQGLLSDYRHAAPETVGLGKLCYDMADELLEARCAD